MPGLELINEAELQEINNIFEKGNGILFRHGFDQIRNGSYKVKEFEQSFALHHGINYGLGVTSGTAALRVALAALDIQPGDEVITQAFTFVATVEAIVESGAKPICANIDETLNLDPDEIEKLLSSKTKAVIAVHMLGTPCKIDKIKSICDKHNLFLIEDTAWGCGGKLDSKPLGTWGDFGAFSFDFAKTITTGEGGMLITDSKKLHKKASAWHDHGHENNPDYPRWEDTRSSSGFNFRMMEIQGAIGLAQLKKLNFIVETQRDNARKIWNEIKDFSFISKRSSPNNSFETFDALVIELPSSEYAIKCRECFLSNGISTKILPEAISWHFAGMWNHIKELELTNSSYQDYFEPSYVKLSRCVAIPITIKMKENFAELVKKSLRNL